ncbi:MAG: Ldh family oxidoreductase [Candidatus Rokubacteria bacterium]|nr:Ldh family oxidoreductase [Candidatus Rokubacteria bacterium]
MADSPVVVRPEALQGFIVAVLEALRMPRRNAELTAALMVKTDLRGVDSHGIGMLPRYVEWTRAGYIHPWAEPIVVRDDLATALLDGQKGLGHPVSVMGMELALAKAGTYGLGIVAVRNSNHFGACANYSMMALERGMIGLAFTNSPFVAMVPTFARQPMMGTNPISLAAPAATHTPFVLDMATTTVAVGKLTIAARWNHPIPEGWALAEGGRPTTDARAALAARLLSPLGGRRELGSHKGYGLGVMVDILSGVLSGGVYGDLLDRKGLRTQRLTNTGHCFAAIDIARFRPVEEFEAAMDDMLQALNDTPRAEGQERVYTAGEPEAEAERHRRAHGIPVAPALVAQVGEIAASLGVLPLA